MNERTVELRSKLIRILKTVVMYLSFISLGMCTSVIGPCLLELAKNVGLHTSKVSTIYIARALGVVTGCMAGGVILDKFKDRWKEFILMLFTMCMGGATIIIGWLHVFTPLVIAMVVSGICMGAVDTGLNVWCLMLWEENSPYFQALHFCFGIGAVAGPAIAGVFLPHFAHNYTLNHPTLNMTSVLHNETDASNTDENILVYPFSVIGVATLICGSLYICLFTSFSSAQLPSKQFQYFATECRRNVTVLLGLLVLTIYAGIEIGYGQMIALYAVRSQYEFTESAASYMTAAYWGTFTVARGLSVALAMKMNLFAMLILDCILMLGASLILTILGNTHEAFVWLGNGMLGFGFASFYPAVISYIEKRVYVTHKVGAFFVVAGSLGEMIAPLLISQFIDSYPEFLFHVTLFCTVVVSFLCLALAASMIGLKDKEVIVEPEREVIDLRGCCQDKF